ncbi:hypothetical protein W97_07841 [Coniosporium apollinis CBS 100218]|uniref:Deoxyribonuclease NucA/NucB domain-containing protein n=1 Tax=Coniosporium apollinis (strain CBS 100218) TaxID=1168221 RepID=R7Z3C4_CONA1|nr:uncharacterized protein W97_07841 [Coniosporium apollinis CBS 100218]EON68583.1 hypothetical protein W97_07841 [Coniosporium apollinis CBS 100218]
MSFTVNMRSILTAAILLRASVCLAADTDTGNYYGPGRADRMLPRAAPQDFGTFKVNCRGSEGACNNACYYIRCEAPNDPDANKITYIGPNGNNGEADRNRYESGCQAQQGGSVCGNFPFSQKFIDDQSKATSYTCDEWPPAASQQETFDKKAHKNSLRCMPGGENSSLGAKIGNFINNRGTFPGRPGGVMARGDYFRVDPDVTNADQSKVKFCLGQGTTNCGSDGFQFEMTAKKTQNGKISSPYDPKGTDNHYALQNTVYKDIFQCSVELTRDGDNDFKNVKLFDWENKEVTQTTSCSIPGNTGTCDLQGLPNDLQLEKQGNFGTKLGFTYAPGSQNTNVNYYKWDSETTGDGRGPATDDGSPLRFCKVTTSGNEQSIECWFPCYQNVDGK